MVAYAREFTPVSPPTRLLVGPTLVAVSEIRRLPYHDAPTINVQWYAETTHSNKPKRPGRLEGTNIPGTIRPGRPGALNNTQHTKLTTHVRERHNKHMTPTCTSMF